MKHRKITTGIAMHAHFSHDVVATMPIGRNLQGQGLKAHAVVGTDHALVLLAQNVIQTTADPRDKG
jgi:hypothetical protein